MRSRAVISGTVLCSAVLSGGWFVERGLRANTPDSAQRAHLYEQVLEHVADDYVDTLKLGDLYKRSVDGLLHELNDPHTVLLTPDRLARLNETTTGRYGGVGIQIDVRDGWITIVSPLSGGPAEQVGIQTGDRVVAIDGRSTKDWTPDEATKALRGAPGSPVRLEVERPGVADHLTFSLKRQEIHYHAVRHAIMLRDDIGYIDLATFSEDAVPDVAAAVDSLRTRGMRTLVFDLREDPGGLLDQGVGLADLFLNPGQRIVSMKGRTPDANRAYDDRTSQRWPDLRLVVLVDSLSASASEIVAGALQDHDRAVLMGTTTYGKGSAQTLYPVGSGSALKLTTARWFTPSGRSIDRPHVPSAGDDIDGPRVGPDTATAAPTFKTDSGRKVLGGGGITPDVVVADSAPSAQERALDHAIGTKISVFRDVLAAYALDLKARHALASADFTVTPDMRGELRRRLAARAVTIDSATYAGAAPLVDRWIGSQVARYAFGERAEFQRAVRDDRTIQAALRLAAGARTQGDLLERAQSAKRLSLVSDSSTKNPRR
jgi:carboxyl-terminal processing protease